MKQILNLFRTPSVEILARRELEEAQRELLVALRNAEYCASMVKFQQARIARLSTVVPRT